MNPSVTIQTNRGPIALELYPSQAPSSLSNFLLYAFDDFYDEVIGGRFLIIPVNNANSYLVQALDADCVSICQKL